MLGKMMTAMAVLALVLAACVPALAQLESQQPDDYPRAADPAYGEYILQTGADTFINCGSVFGIVPDDPLIEPSGGQTSPEILEQIKQLCAENGVFPPTSLDPVDTGFVQYDPPPICQGRGPDGYCTTVSYPDGMQEVRDRSSN